MEWWLLFLLTVGHFSTTQPACQQPVKFYVDCGITRTASDATQFCNSHQMTLVNITNATGTLIDDIALLNNTFGSNNCVGYFWFSFNNQTGLVINVNALGQLVDGLLSGILNPVLCSISLACFLTTTAVPITNAYTVCTRPIQQHVVQKCSSQSGRLDMTLFRFNEQTMQAGVLDRFTARSRTACSGLCSSNNACVGMSYNNSICTLYM